MPNSECSRPGKPRIERAMQNNTASEKRLAGTSAM